MEELLTKLADVLDMSVDGILKAYPVLKNQYINSYLWNQASSIIGVFIILTIIVTLWLIIEIFMTGGDIEAVTTLVVSLVVFFILMIIEILITNKVIQIAPDLLFLESLSHL